VYGFPRVINFLSVIVYGEIDFFLNQCNFVYGGKLYYQQITYLSPKTETYCKLVNNVTAAKVIMMSISIF